MKTVEFREVRTLIPWKGLTPTIGVKICVLTSDLDKGTDFYPYINLDSICRIL